MVKVFPGLFVWFGFCVSGRFLVCPLLLSPFVLLWSEGLCFGMRVTRCRESASGAGGTGWKRITYVPGPRSFTVLSSRVPSVCRERVLGLCVSVCSV